jgi:type IX secretion system PorP/SprF family membrane protein
MKRFILFLFLINSAEVFSQDFVSTQYYSNLGAVNPGFVGVDDFLDVKFSVFQGWNGFDVRNNNFYVSAFGVLNNTGKANIKNNALRLSSSVYSEIESSKGLNRRHGMGGMISGRNLGPYRSVEFSYQYAYHLPINKHMTFSLGTKLGYLAQRIDFSDLRVSVGDDEFFNRILVANNGNRGSYVIDFGGVLYSKNFYFGVSTNRLVLGTLSEGLEINLAERQQVSGQMATIFSTGPNIKVNFGLSGRYVEGADIHWDANTRVRYKELFYFGAAYSKASRFSLLAGFSLGPKLHAHYTYDQYLSSLGSFNVNAHEIVVGVALANRAKASVKYW